MELRHLRYFVTVAEHLSFRQAAERLHLSHPTLTKQIDDLENELGLKLFNRNHRRVELTEVGVSWFSVKWKFGALALASRSHDRFS